jgi:hypothetical protein
VKLRKRKLCSQEGCRKRVQQGGVYHEHGARKWSL